eukprot:2243014-Alexandrium_andersonii.AAC.1
MLHGRGAGLVISKNTARELRSEANRAMASELAKNSQQHMAMKFAALELAAASSPEATSGPRTRSSTWPRNSRN